MCVILLFNIRQKYSVTDVVANINHAKRKFSPSKTYYKKKKMKYKLNKLKIYHRKSFTS